MTSQLRRLLIPTLLSFSTALLGACGVEEPAQEAPPEQATVVADSASTAALEENRPITPEEIEEVRNSADFAATMEILLEDGETITLESGITSMHEASLNGVDITFIPVDESGRPSQRTLEVVYQRSDTSPPHFYFVSNESGAPSATPTEKPSEAPISATCLGGIWTSWFTTWSYCGYRRKCGQKFKYDAWFQYQRRSKRCWNGTTVTQTRHHFAHCGC
ncbi:MAG: hypothetical protein R3B48_15080 [Kofleriaceae bacterium]